MRFKQHRSNGELFVNIFRLPIIAWLAAAGGFLFVGPAMADDAALNSGDTAGMLTATALVLFMTIPGLALFYAGKSSARIWTKSLRSLHAVQRVESFQKWF